MKFKTLSAALLVSAVAQAQTIKPVVLKSPNEFYVTKVSPNGKWACGAFIDDNSETYAFRWNLESNEVEVLNPAVTSYTQGVSNTGVIVGYYSDDTYATNGATIKVPGYYDTQWHRLELPADEDEVTYGVAYDITPDGKYICGTLSFPTGEYNSYIWKDGKLLRELQNNKISMPYAISPDGTMASGWMQRKNRTACLWDKSGQATYLTTYEGPWSYGRQFTSDGKKLLYYGGWEKGANGKYGTKTIYDIQTKDSKLLYPSVDFGNFEFYALSDDGTALGVMGDNACIYESDKDSVVYLADYLMDKDIDLSKEHIYIDENIPDVYQLVMGVGISADSKVMALRYYNDDKDEDGNNAISIQSMIVKFDQSSTLIAPTSVKAEQVNGLNSVKLSWKPNVSAQGITGYNVYRDGNKLNSAAITGKQYIDADVAYGTHNYTVSAIYGSTESEKSDLVAVKVVGKAVSTPSALYATQHGYNSAYMEWSVPSSNFPTLTYFNPEVAELEGFGNSNKDAKYEVAVSFDSIDVAAYKGKKIQSVGFYPMSEQKDWKINFYTHDASDKLQLLYSQPVTQQLKYGVRNVVNLSTPLSLPAGELLVAVQVTVATAEQNINGMDFGHAKQGYTDLVREANDADFYSLGEFFQTNGYMYPACWAIDAVVADDGVNLNKDVVDHYRITADGKQVAESKATSYTVTNLSEGSHALGVYAVYADGTMSETNTYNISIAPNSKLLTGVDTALVAYDSPTAIVAAWDAPADHDCTTMQYCDETPNPSTIISAPASNNYAITAGVLYGSNMFRGRNGYKIKSVRFYPLADAVFTVQIYKDDEMIDEIDVDDYKLNAWNTVDVDKEILIDSKSSYRVAIDCYDAEPNTAPLAIDNATSVGGYSDTYSLDSGESWSDLSSSSAAHNWLISMDIESAKAVATLPATGYDVNIDGKKANTSVLTDRHFRYNFGAEDAKQHTISIDTYYAVSPTSVKGDVTRFMIGATGINGNVIDQINVAQGDNEVSVAGNATSVELISASGAIVASAKGNTVSLNGVAAGVYVVRAQVDGENIIRKIRIVR